MRTLIFDIMLDDRFVCTQSLSLDNRLVDEYVLWGGVIQPVINSEVLHERIEDLHPSLRGKDFKICF